MIALAILLASLEATPILELEKRASIVDGPPVGPEFGVIRSPWTGRPCAFSQLPTHEDSLSYFTGRRGSDTVLVFADETCMLGPGGDSVQLPAAARAINRQVVRWYVEQGDYALDPRPGGGYQQRGWCLQSRRYSIQAVAIDYFAGEKGLRAVIHRDALPCGDRR